MGKKQHSKDRMFITKTEWQRDWGGYKGKQAHKFNRLPYHCCAVSFTPFEDPVCTDDGTCFDIIHIVPYIKKFGKHPRTGEPLKTSELTKLNFHKNSDGEYHCPVMNKVFTDHTHIVAVKETGNVYCNEAIQELNAKTKNWKDLLTDEPFKKKNLITIQDPLNLEGRTLQEYDMVKNELQVEEANDDPMESIKNQSEDMKRMFKDLGTDKAAAAFEAGGGGRAAQAERLLAAARSDEVKREAAEAAARGGPKHAAIKSNIVTDDPRMSFKPGSHTWNTDDDASDKPIAKAPAGGAGAAAGGGTVSTGASRPAGIYRDTSGAQVKMVESKNTTGACSRSFTSTTWEPTTKNSFAMVRLERNPKKKGYCRLRTSHGDLNLELHCDLCPRTCENFITLAERGYYDGTVFHRSIKNFMIQGGDPTGTGTGGESIYGKKFKDELTSALVHSGRGVVSMANSGRDTNGSQFFILYKSATHLDYKHTVFARVVGGVDTLGVMEKVPTDDADRPKTDITLLGIDVFSNPYTEEEEDDTEKKAEEAKQKVLEETHGAWFSNPSGHVAVGGTGGGGVGKYLAAAGGGAAGAAAAKKVKKVVAAPAVEGGAGGAAGAGGAGAGGMEPPPAKKKKASGGFGNFDAW